MEKEQLQPPVLVPSEMISAEAFSALIGEFILREGTDYGVHEVEFEKKKEQIVRQVLAGKVKIVFDPNLGSVTLMNERDWMKLNLD